MKAHADRFEHEIDKDNVRIFAGNACPALAAEIAKKFGVPLSKATVSTFSDGEIQVHITDSVRGRDIFIIQSTSQTAQSVNDNLMELLIMIDSLRRASANRITAVIPYFGYARQDRKAQPRDPITAKLVADLITTAGADRVLTMDLHAPQIQGFFDIPVDHLYGSTVIAEYMRKQESIMTALEQDGLVVVSPDVGSAARARAFAEELTTPRNGASRDKTYFAPLAIVEKRRQKANSSEVLNVVGSVDGKVCLMLDDMIDTGGTIIKGAAALIAKGRAKEVHVCCTHPVLSGDAVDKLEKSVLLCDGEGKFKTDDKGELIIEKREPGTNGDFKFIIETATALNTIENARINGHSKIKVVSVAPIFAKAIEIIYTDGSMSVLYPKK